MIKEICSGLETGKIEKIVVAGWLKSLDIPYSGSLKDILTRLEDCYGGAAEHKITKNQVTSFMQSINLGGTKHILMYNLKKEDWDKISFKKIIAKANDTLIPDYKFIDSHEAEDVLVLNYSRAIEYSKALNETYAVDQLFKHLGAFYIPATILKDELNIQVHIDKKKKAIMVWFDSFGNLNRHFSKKPILISAELLIKNLLSLPEINRYDLSNTIKRLNASDLCKSISDKLTHRGTNKKNQQTNVTINLKAHANSQGNMNELEEAENLYKDNPKIEYDAVLLKWFEDKSNGGLLRNINTKIIKKGEVDFTTFATKEEIEYVLQTIIKAFRNAV